MSALFSRLKAETPKFFKRIRNAGITLGGLSFALLMYQDSLPEYWIPLVKHGVGIGCTAAFFAQCAKEDKPTQEIKKPWVEA